MSVPPLPNLGAVMADVDDERDPPWLQAVEDEDATADEPSWRVIIALTGLSIVLVPLFLSYCGSL